MRLARPLVCLGVTLLQVAIGQDLAKLGDIHFSRRLSVAVYICSTKINESAGGWKGKGTYEMKSAAGDLKNYEILPSPGSIICKSAKATFCINRKKIKIPIVPRLVIYGFRIFSALEMFVDHCRE